jgi:hypothetical protein
LTLLYGYAIGLFQAQGQSQKEKIMKPASSKLRLSLIMLALSTTTAFSAEINLAGRSFTLKSSKGTAQVTYASDTMTGTATNAIGITSTDTGVWYRTGANSICQRWNHWLDGKTHCLTLRPIGSMVKWTDQNGVTGIAK